MSGGATAARRAAGETKEKAAKATAAAASTARAVKGGWYRVHDEEPARAYPGWTRLWSEARGEYWVRDQDSCDAGRNPDIGPEIDRSHD